MARVALDGAGGRREEGGESVAAVMTTIIISIATSLVVAALVTILGCYRFKVYIESEINRILDEEGVRTETHVLEVIELAKCLIRNAHSDK